MWRLWHALFGWHYVNISVRRPNGRTDYHQCRRVYVDGDGRPYTHWCRDMVYLSDDPSADDYSINPLTFPRAAMNRENHAA